MIRNKKLGLSKLALAAMLMASSQVHALTAGASYTVSIGKINSNGSETVLSTSPAVVADATGKITFSLSSVPDNTTCNFMTVVVKNSAAPNAIVQSGMAPCATAGTTLPLGVSAVTSKQNEALKAGFIAAGTDDPILAVFGLAIVRTQGITSAEITALATIVKNAITGAGGFTDYLTTTRGVTAAQMAAYRRAIIAQLSDVNSGYSKLVKDSVDASAGAAESGKRGEAAGLLMDILVKAATTAGFPQDYILEAFNAMGAIAVPAIQAAVPATLSANTAQGINSSIGGAIQKAKTSRVTEKYSEGILTLGGSGADVTQFQTAATTLSTAMQTAFSTFEQSAFQTGTENAAAIQSAQTALDTAMNTAFNNFTAGTAVSNARIQTLITNICTAVHPNAPATFAICTGNPVGTGRLPASYFRYYDQAGNPSNWPVNMVVLTDWVSANKIAGGSLTYTRDTTAIPAGMWWMTRTCFGGIWNAAATAPETGTCQGLPADYANLLAIQEDIEILQMARWSALSGSSNMGSDQATEKAFTDKLYTTITGLIGGNVKAGTPITAVQKDALVTLMSPPEM